MSNLAIFGIKTPMKLTRELLFWVSTIGIGILILVALCGYSCFITRYRNYLKKRTIKEFGNAAIPG